MPRRSKSRSKSRGGRGQSQYNKFIKAHFGACYKEACKKYGTGSKATRQAMKACAARYSRSKSK